MNVESVNFSRMFIIWTIFNRGEQNSYVYHMIFRKNYSTSALLAQLHFFKALQSLSIWLSKHISIQFHHITLANVTVAQKHVNIDTLMTSFGENRVSYVWRWHQIICHAIWSINIKLHRMMIYAANWWNASFTWWNLVCVCAEKRMEFRLNSNQILAICSTEHVMQQSIIFDEKRHPNDFLWENITHIHLNDLVWRFCVCLFL